MDRDRRVIRTACVAFVVSLAGVVARPAAAVDLSGVYASTLEIFSTPCTLTFVQTGTLLTIDGPCQSGTTTYTFDLSGTVDELTGDFSTSGVLLGLCETPGSVTMIGTGDGTVFSAVSTCGVSAVITGSKCNNGILDANEDCEDGNTTAGDCCSPTCQYDSAGTTCAADTNVCTRDECDGAGLCVHPPDPTAEGDPCAADANACTDDVCDALGQCTHPPNADPCDDANACTSGDACAAGACVGGPLLPECVGSLDLTGDWAITGGGGLFGASPARRFVQTGAVLESTDLATGLTGVGSVNPATRTLEAHTPFSLFIFPCLEIITATATIDAQEFTGTSAAYCGIEGNYGPFPVTGRRCDPVLGCACDLGVACVSSDVSTRILAYDDEGDLRTRWRWGHSAMPVNLGDPTVGTDYRLCLQTPDGGFTEAALHGSNWRKTRKGFRYTDDVGPIRRLRVQSKSNGVSFTASLVPTAPPSLPLTVPVSLRLMRLGVQPLCFEATFDDPTVNTSQRFRAKE